MFKALMFLFFYNVNSFASYSHNLTLCDLGLRNGNSFNQLGVDFIQYSLAGRVTSVTAGANFSSAVNQELSGNSLYNQWDINNGISDVSMNLGSDYFGTEYYLQYCYTFDRQLPNDNITYEVTTLSSMPVNVPETLWTSDTTCSLKYSNGVIINSQSLNASNVTNLITTDIVSARCTIKLNFTESSYFKLRPHSGDPLSIDPSVIVRVAP